MPIRRGNDKTGSFWQYGESGKKYYYTPGDTESRKAAKAKAIKQGEAIEYSEDGESKPRKQKGKGFVENEAAIEIDNNVSGSGVKKSSRKQKGRGEWNHDYNNKYDPETDPDNWEREDNRLMNQYYKDEIGMTFDELEKAPDLPEWLSRSLDRVRENWDSSGIGDEIREWAKNRKQTGTGAKKTRKQKGKGPDADTSNVYTGSGSDSGCGIDFEALLGKKKQ